MFHKRWTNLNAIASRTWYEELPDWRTLRTYLSFSCSLLLSLSVNYFGSVCDSLYFHISQVNLHNNNKHGLA